jgi:quercetin dioxygenase-like cupin family protein
VTGADGGGGRPAGFRLGPGQGDAYGFHGSTAIIKASGADTHGQLCVIESHYPAGLAVPEHVHADEDEMFYVLAGELAVSCGGQRWMATEGSFVFVPRDTPHAFTVTGPGPARALVVTGPPRLDQQIAGRGEPGPGQ